jgi:hypothetical protein
VLLHLPLLVLLGASLALHREQEELDLVEILILVAADRPHPLAAPVVHQLWVVVVLVEVVLEETMVVEVEVETFLVVVQALEHQELQS